jgi:hypothetical protein
MGGPVARTSAGQTSARPGAPAAYGQQQQQQFKPQPVQQKWALSEADFETMKVIGRGSYGRVLLVRKKDTREVLTPLSYVMY